MREMQADLWKVDADIRVITTNGTVKRNGKAVMGRGCAAEARKRYRGIAGRLGEYLTFNGNRPFRLYRDLVTLPVKHNWWEKEDPDLIVQSVKYMVAEVEYYDRVVMPRPGCGNGGLDWADVKPLIEPYLDDKFTVVHYPEED
jgi:hypothetical protein